MTTADLREFSCQFCGTKPALFEAVETETEQGIQVCKDCFNAVFGGN